MDITFISDTHGLHHELKLIKGDLLVHGGDITEYGTEAEVIDFLEWYGKQPFKYKLFIAGNHDIFLENCSRNKLKKMIPDGILYLQNEAVVIDNLTFFGSPFTPYYMGMAFNAKDNERKIIWNKIPKATDILITHSPPYGILDNNLGCKHLLNKVTVIQPKLHLFGHIHEANGVKKVNNTIYVNNAMANTITSIEVSTHRLVHQPFITTI